MLKEFKECKATVNDKFAQALKITKQAEKEFRNSIERIVTNASVNDLREFMNSDEVTDDDKELILGAFKVFNNSKFEIIELDDETLDKLMRIKDLLS